jgi:uncharacterized protein
MNAKTERFEMRFEPETLARIDAWREQQGGYPSRAEAIRFLVEAGLDGTARNAVRMSDGEKLILATLCDLVKKNSWKTEIDVGLISESIYGGHYWAPKWEMQEILHDHTDSPAVVTDVVNILDMWSFIESAYTKLNEPEKKRIADEIGPLGENPKFHGFDGNNEGEYMSIARFFVEKMDRWQFLKGRSFNSHSQVVSRYLAMYCAFEPIRAKLVGRNLTTEEIIEIMKSR